MPDNKSPLSGFFDDLKSISSSQKPSRRENGGFADLFSTLNSVASDLYGENNASLERLSRDVQEMTGVDPTLMQTAPAQEPAPAAEAKPIPEKKPVPPPFEALWKVADEPIDWTEVFASPTPTDGLTSPAKWKKYREYAASVLHGDLPTYLKVLNAANPMADLMPYVAALDVAALNSDALRAEFSARPDLLPGDEGRRYLCGMAVRIARDLFAVLPVTHVTVAARHDGKELLTVEFARQELNKVRFAFIDPVAFTTECGGVFAPQEP